MRLTEALTAIHMCVLVVWIMCQGLHSLVLDRWGAEYGQTEWPKSIWTLWMGERRGESPSPSPLLEKNHFNQLGLCNYKQGQRQGGGGREQWLMWGRICMQWFPITKDGQIWSSKCTLKRPCKMEKLWNVVKGSLNRTPLYRFPIHFFLQLSGEKDVAVGVWGISQLKPWSDFEEGSTPKTFTEVSFIQRKHI